MCTHVTQALTISTKHTLRLFGYARSTSKPLIIIFYVKGPIWFFCSESPSYWHVPILRFIHTC